MQNFSSHRPPRSAVYQPPPAPQPEAPFPEEHLAGFSPLLASLLSLTIKDGLCNKTAFHLLRDIYPYVSSPDRQTIDGLLEMQQIAGDIASRGPYHGLQPYTMKRALTNREKLFGLLKVLRRYGGRESDATFTQLERALDINDKIQKYSGKPGGPAQDMASMLGLLSQMGGPNGRPGGKGNPGPMGNMGQMAQMMGQMGQMQNMMKMMGNMKNMGNSGAGGSGMDPSMMASLMQMMNGNKT